VVGTKYFWQEVFEGYFTHTFTVSSIDKGSTVASTFLKRMTLVGIAFPKPTSDDLMSSSPHFSSWM